MQIELINDDYSCPNCYYEWFDDKAYPCSRCIHNKPSEDMFKAKIAEQTEPQTVCPKCGRSDYIKDLEKDFGVRDKTFKYKCINCNTYIKDEPQIHGIFREGELSDEQLKELKRQVNLFVEYAEKKKDEPQTDCAWK